MTALNLEEEMFQILEDKFNPKIYPDIQSLGYKVNPRRFKDIWPILEKSGMCKREDFSYNDDAVVYSGAEHRGNPKLPNQTVLPNLWIGSYILLGSTLGHQHTQAEKGDRRRFQEIYEFHGYGAILLRDDFTTTLYVLKPGEKVIIGTRDNMTLFNLDYCSLTTLDMANPQKNPNMNEANKDLEKLIGPLMIVKHGKLEGSDVTIFRVNKKYKDKISVKTFEPIVVVSRLGTELYERMKESRMEFWKRGIRIIHGGNVPKDLKKEFSPPLLELAQKKNKTLMEILEMR
ncbi:hypothetical protein FJZ19_04760 [Candidatus Pacearchaeota archaeon]|nr:hypothetical protein [Candidatus Pacearchaeota archaeon]